ncbi:MAG TPA: DUF4209 domain-containing protein, partial [Candidatus Dormibacteraeota bacterium]|nr:DUF4209 domain-containing protein [Candidatus Dormibacteraeota bacterium]
ATAAWKAEEDRPRFTHQVGFSNGAVWPDPAAVTGAHLEEWERFLGRTGQNPLLRARFADLLSVFGTKDIGRWGRIAIEAYLEFADLASRPDVQWDVEAADARARATDLACQLRDDAHRLRASSAVLSMVERYANEGRWRGLLEPLEYVVRKREVFTGAEVARAISQVRPAMESLNPMLAQMLSNLMVQGSSRIGDDETAAAELRREAQLMIEMGESIEAASPSSAATHFLQAIEVLTRIGDAEEEVDRLAQRVKRLHREGARRARTFSISVPVQGELVEETRDSLRASASPAAVAAWVAGRRALVVDVGSVRETLQLTRADAPLVFMIPRKHVSEGNFIKQDRSREEVFEGILAQHAQELVLASLQLLAQILFPLKDEGLVTLTGVMEVVRRSELLGDQDLELIDRGVERFFAGDHASSIHLLVPRLEAAIRGLMDKLGRATTRQQRDGTTRELDLYSVLGMPEVVDNLGGDDAYLFKLILVDGRGPRIRHRVAHGNLTAAECTEMTAFMIVVLLLHLSGYVRTPPDGTPEEADPQKL